MNTSDLTLKRLNDYPLFAILIIDDMENIRKQLVSDIRSLDYKGHIIEVDTLAKAEAALGTRYFDLVICDRNLPDGLGLDFIVKLRSHPRFSKTPLMMCTTNNEKKFIVESIKLGANEYIGKPWVKEELAKKILAIIPAIK